jgi:hypothetical protein
MKAITVAAITSQSRMRFKETTRFYVSAACCGAGVPCHHRDVVQQSVDFGIFDSVRSNRPRPILPRSTKVKNQKELR